MIIRMSVHYYYLLVAGGDLWLFLFQNIELKIGSVDFESLQ